MRELYTLELARLVKELGALEGSYIDQFYEIERGRFRIKIGRREEKLNLQCMIPYTINRTERIEVREDATNFSLAVRKRIGGARIKGVSLLNNDRIIMFTLEKAGSEMNLIFEMFGKGNTVITDPSMKILLAYQVHEFKDRAIKPGMEYKTPANQSVDITDAEAVSKARKELASESSEIILGLNKKFGVGKMYVEESVRRAGIDTKAKTDSIDHKALDKMLENLKDVVQECTKSPKFIAYEHEGKVANIALCSIDKYESFEKREFKTMEECLDYASSSSFTKEEGPSEDEEKTLASIEKQKKILDGIKSDINSNKLMGDYIINNMHELNTLINELKKNKAMTKQELQKLSDTIEILNINMKTKSVRIKPKEGRT